jgi:hypothetical protein
MIVASQYDKWVTPGGVEAKDRLDLLGLDKDGRLVVAELKRGRAPDTVELQAVKYAAMTSRFTLDKLAELHARFLERTSNETLTNEEAEEKLQAHVAADVELSPELLARPRIVLVAEGYPDTTVTSVVWLAEQGVDITLRRYKAYETVLARPSSPCPRSTPSQTLATGSWGRVEVLRVRSCAKKIFPRCRGPLTTSSSFSS